LIFIIHRNLPWVFYFTEHNYYPFTIVSNSDCLWKSDILVGNIVIWHNTSILDYNWITLNQLGNWQQDEYLFNKETSYDRTWRQSNKKISWPPACLKQSWTAYIYTCFLLKTVKVSVYKLSYIFEFSTGTVNTDPLIARILVKFLKIFTVNF
jgi:hypothetical protein